MVEIMVFRRRMSQLRPVHSIKHIVDNQGGIVFNNKESVTLVASLDAPVLANVTEVETGSRVNGLYLNVQVVATTEAALGNVYFFIWKNPAGAFSAGAVPNGNATGSDDIKRQIFHTEMRMTSNSSNTQIPITVFNGVISIPKHMRTMRVNDRIDIQLFSPGVNLNYCIQAIYKEYR